MFYFFYSILYVLLLSTFIKLQFTEAASYAHVLDGARSADAVSAGLRVITHTTCSFTSLGALGMGTRTVKCLNAAAGYLKKRAVAVARTAPRDDGLAPQRLSALFRFRVRCELQAAIMRGNGLIAAEVGL